jgi:GT2 family glycosyltransferase
MKIVNLSIIIINYNTFETTCDCLKSLYKFNPKCSFEVLLVDNASSECDPNLFLEKFPTVKLIQSAKNLGFAGGNNLGLDHAIGEYILLLNSDTIFIEDCITPCIEFMEHNPKIGVLNPKLLNPDLSYQKNARRFKNITRELLDFFRPFIKLFPYKFYSKYFLNQYFKGDYNTECDWVSGAFFLTKREVINKFKVKKLDDRFFMYGEDTLWCFLIQQFGFSIYFLAEPQIIHIGSVSTNKEKLLKLSKVILEREMELFRLKTNNIFLIQFYKIILNFKDLMYRKLN